MTHRRKHYRRSKYIVIDWHVFQSKVSDQHVDQQAKFECAALTTPIQQSGSLAKCVKYKVSVTAIIPQVTENSL
jgi:hypothetical protein